MRTSRLFPPALGSVLFLGLVAACSGPDGSDASESASVPTALDQHGPLSWSGWSEIAGGGTTDAAPAAATLDHRVYVFAKGVGDKRVYINSAIDSGAFGGWSLVDASFQTDAAPSAATLFDRVYVAGKHVGDGGVYLASFAGPRDADSIPAAGLPWWTFGQIPGMTTDTTPAMVGLRNKLFLVAKSADQHYFVATAYANNAFQSWLPLSAGGTTDVAPAAAALGDRLYVFGKGINDKRVYITSQPDDLEADVKTPSTAPIWGWTQVQNSVPVTTPSSPSATGWGDRLVVARRTAANTIEINVAHDHEGFDGWQTIPGVMTTDAAPAIVSLRDTLHVYVKGTNGKIYVNRAKDAATQAKLGAWAPPVPTDAIVPSPSNDPTALHIHGIFAVNAALTYDPQSDKAKVMLYGGHAQIQDVNAPLASHEYPLVTWTWDPTNATFSSFQPFGDMQTDDPFCNHLVHLPDGRLLAMGGEAQHGPGLDAERGIKATYVFDPHTEAWTKLPDMAYARWYPTPVALPDGEILVASGFDEKGLNPETITKQIEIFDPKVDPAQKNPWRVLAGADRELGVYPSLHVIPSGAEAGKILYTGTKWGSNATGTFAPIAAILDWKTGQWKDLGTLPTKNHTEGASVLLPFAASKPSARTMVFGGSQVAADGYPMSTSVLSTGAAPGAAMFAGPNMLYRRTNVTGVTLADGKVLLVGGEQTYKRDHSNQPVLQAEIFDPATNTFAYAAWMQKPRTYHSTALLLPDGRVFVAGGEDQSQAARLDWDNKSYEIYSPPYLFRGARPVISSAPKYTAYGSAFNVAASATGKTIARFALVRPSTVTHHTNSEQRFIDLSFTATASGFSVTGPADGNVAPPGWYMLFAIDSDGVPSVAKWVHVAAPTVIIPIGVLGL